MVFGVHSPLADEQGRSITKLLENEPVVILAGGQTEQMVNF